MKHKTLLKWIWLWPPFLGAGISVKQLSPDLLSLVVQMKLRFWNKNYFGTQFGGSLFSMTDPFYAILLLAHLGKDYIIWDKSADIQFKNPGRGRVYAHFELSQPLIEDLRRQTELQEKIEPQFKVYVKDELGTVIAEINKTLYIRRKTKIPQR